MSFMEQEIALQSQKLRKELQNAAKAYNILEMDDWYKISGKQYEQMLGTKFKHQYDYSPSQVLSFAFPEYDWLPWRFRRCPMNFWDKPKNQRRYMIWAANELGFTELDGWYNVTREVFLKVGGGSILLRYNGSVSQALIAIFPEYDWLPWRFAFVPNNTWTDSKNHKKFIEWAANELNIKDMSDWYNVKCEDLQKLGGIGLMYQHSNSVYQVLQSVYPDYDWLPWKFERTPLNYFENIAHQRKFMDCAAKEMKFESMEDWYRMDLEELNKFVGGSFATTRYSSLYKLLLAVYPEYNWLPWRFDKAPHFWVEPENQRKFLEWAGQKLGVKTMSDWYNISNQQIADLGGSYLLNTYHDSRPKMFSTLYPEYEWQMWKFLQRPIAKHMKKQSRLFVDTVALELRILQPSDWYKVTVKDLRRIKGGDTILRAFGGSIYKLLVDAYPNIHWFPWRFSPEYFADPNNWKYFVESVAKELKIKELKDWNNVETERIIDLGGGALLVKHSSLGDLLSFVYPEVDWDTSKFPDIWKSWGLSNYLVDWLKNQPRDEISLVYNAVKEKAVKGVYPLIEALRTAFPDFQWLFNPGKKKTQYMLKYCLLDLFKNELLLEEYKHPEFDNLELDYFYPQLKLAIEYQGQQHYKEVSLFSSTSDSMEEFKYRDMQKAQVCKKNGITLVEIPYWWDRKLTSLEATIYNARPDLFTKREKPQGTAIPFTKTEPLVIKSVFRDFLMIPIEWEKEKINPKGWYLTEKYDGIRLYWSGSKFYTRQGRELHLPDCFAKDFPPVALDGELWTQYGLYQDPANLIKITNEEKWKRAVFWVFDSPQNPDQPLEKRIELIKQLDLPPFIRLVDFIPCEGEQHMKDFTDAISAKGGEGVVIREPGSLYKPGKSKSVLKYKPFFDTEVRVVVNQFPYGFICEQISGKQCFVRISDSVLPDARDVVVGDVVTVKHSGVNVHGTLLFPQFYRPRVDVTWEELNKASV